MSDFIDRMAYELTRAARAAAAAPATNAGSARGRLRRYLGALSRRQRVAAVVALAVAVASPALAATQPWNPQPQQIVTRTGANPAEPVPTTHVSVSDGAPPASQLRLLSVLRRAATPRDRSEKVDRALGQLFGGIEGIEIRYVRVLNDTPGEPLVLLIPAKRWSGPSGTTTSVADALCVDVVDASGSGGSCEPTDALTGGHISGSGGQFEYHVVPDGVASAVLSFQNGTRKTVSVRNNFLGFRTTSQPPEFPTSIEWRDSRGNPVNPR